MADLDFQTRRPGLLSVCLLLAGGLLAADAVVEDTARRERLEELSGQIERVERRLQKRQYAER